MTTDNPAPPPGGLSGLIRLLHLSGASDEVVNNFVRLYLNAQAPQPAVPIVELGPAIEAAAKEAARVTAEAFVAQHFSHGLPPPASISEPAPVTPAAPLVSSANKAAIYHVRISGKKTSVSLPKALLDRSIELLGTEGADQLIQDLASKTPKDMRRSFHVQKGLRAAVAKHERALKAPSSLQ